jgi:tetratricopeptide (TPR) repeat protein
MRPDAARQLSLCAIPHQFDPQVLRALDPTLGQAEAENRCEEFARLSIVTSAGSAWTIHDQSRRKMLDEWLRPDNWRDFSEASARLVSYFNDIVECAIGPERETALRQRMYHLVGAQPEAGFAEFESLCRRARHNLLFSECETLIRLVRDYMPLLSSEQQRWLVYHDAKLALDRRDWEKAEALLKGILADQQASERSRQTALVRLGQVYAEQYRWADAIAVLEQAEVRIRSGQVGDFSLRRAAYELGAAYLGAGELDKAEQYLERAVALAKAATSATGLAIAYNGLGTLYLQRRDVQQALAAFEAALRHLGADEVVLAAQVYNNLGLAYAERSEWSKSAEQFQRSLEVKRNAGDSLGQALAMTNLARIRANEDKLDDAVTITLQAVAIFDDLRDWHNGALARQNLGRYYRRMNRIEEARRASEEARDLLIRLGRTADADRVSADMERLGKRQGLPWWAWTSIVVFGSLVAIFVIIVFIAVAL